MEPHYTKSLASHVPAAPQNRSQAYKIRSPSHPRLLCSHTTHMDPRLTCSSRSTDKIPSSIGRVPRAGRPPHRHIVSHDPGAYPACHMTARISLSSPQAPSASASVTTWWMSFVPLHPLPTTFGPRARAVRRWCSGAKLVRHVVSDTPAVGACGDDSDVRVVVWHAVVYCPTPRHQHDVPRGVPRHPIPAILLRPHVVHP
jgi:hypothetical protein